MKTKLFLALCLLTSVVFSQTFEKTYYPEHGFCKIKQTIKSSDGNLVSVGFWQDSSVSNITYGVVLKTDLNGNELWKTVLDSASQDMDYYFAISVIEQICVVEDSGGNYAVVTSVNVDYSGVHSLMTFGYKLAAQSGNIYRYAHSVCPNFTKAFSGMRYDPYYNTYLFYGIDVHSPKIVEADTTLKQTINEGAYDWIKKSCVTTTSGYNFPNYGDLDAVTTDLLVMDSATIVVTGNSPNKMVGADTLKIAFLLLLNDFRVNHGTGCGYFYPSLSTTTSSTGCALTKLEEDTLMFVASVGDTIFTHKRFNYYGNSLPYMEKPTYYHLAEPIVPTEIIKTYDGYAISGNTLSSQNKTSSYGDGFVMKIDSAYNILWSQTEANCRYNSIKSSSTSLVIAGTKESSSQEQGVIKTLFSDGTSCSSFTLSLGSDTVNSGLTYLAPISNDSNLTYVWNTGETTEGIYASSGVYYVTATNSKGCVASDTIVIDSIVSSIGEVEQRIDLAIYPNPIESGRPFALQVTEVGGTATVFDSMGREVFKESVKQKKSVISLVKPGIYFIQYQTRSFATTQKMDVK